MNHNEEVPDFLGGLGDMLPADVLKLVNFFNEPDEQSGTCSDSAMARKSRMKFNELLEQLHRKEKDHQGSPVFIYAPGSQYVDKQFNIGAYPRPLPKGKGVDSTATASHPALHKGGDLPVVGKRLVERGLSHLSDEGLSGYRKPVCARRVTLVIHHAHPL